MFGGLYARRKPDRLDEMESIAKLLRTDCSDDEPCVRRAKRVLMGLHMDGRKVTIYYDPTVVSFLLQSFPDMRGRVENLYTHPSVLQTGHILSSFGVWYTVDWAELSSLNKAVHPSKFVRLGDWLAQRLHY